MKGWRNQSHNHKLASYGISVRASGRKKIKPLSEVTGLPFNYEKAGYDINNLLLTLSISVSLTKLLITSGFLFKTTSIYLFLASHGFFK